MYKNLKIYAFIPARGGSKRIPRKNLQLLAGKPLIRYTIDAAIKASVFRKVIVSTDDLEIEKISEDAGAEVLKRPPELARDTSTTIDTILHSIDEYGLNPEDIIILLQPTSPLRNDKHIKEALDIYISCNGSPLVSVTKPDHSPYWSYRIKNNFLVPIMEKGQNTMRSQDLPDVYIPNGAIYISDVKTIVKNMTYFSKNTIPYYMKREESIDIDEYIDLKFAEFLIQNKFL